MSSRHVRQLFRSWVAKFTTPYHETVNTESSPQEVMWCTLEFASAFTQRTDLCNGSEEQGSVNVWFFCPAGVGDDTLLAQAEADVDLLMQQTDPSGKVALLGVQPPDDMSGGKDEAAFVFAVDYVFYKD
jgi:hypothetical protein